MSFEISNLIVYFFNSFMTTAVFYVHKSLPDEIAIFLLKVVVRKQHYANEFFFFMYMRGMVNQYIVVVCRGKK